MNLRCHVLLIPQKWDGVPPEKIGTSVKPDDTIHPCQESMKRFMTHIMKLSGESRVSFPSKYKWIERAEKADWLRVFLMSGIRARASVPACKPELQGLHFPFVQKEGPPGRLYLLAHKSVRRGEVALKAVSNHTPKMESDSSFHVTKVGDILEIISSKFFSVPVSVSLCPLNLF